MKTLIRQILKEEGRDSALKKYMFTLFKRQVDSGLTPHIPYEDLRRKKLTVHIESIDKWYFEFLENHYGTSNGFAKAKTLYEEAVTHITEENLKKMDINVGEDKFKVFIPWMEFLEFTNTQMNVKFGFRINDCYLETEDGMKTYEEMLGDDFSDDQWTDVTDVLRRQIEDYLQIKGYDFGLNIFDVDSEWDD